MPSNPSHQTIHIHTSTDSGFRSHCLWFMLRLAGCRRPCPFRSDCTRWPEPGLCSLTGLEAILDRRASTPRPSLSSLHPYPSTTWRAAGIKKRPPFRRPSNSLCPPRGMPVRLYLANSTPVPVESLILRGRSRCRSVPEDRHPLGGRCVE